MTGAGQSISHSPTLPIGSPPTSSATAHRLTSVTPMATPVQSRDLSDYDRMFGVAEEVA